MKKMPASEQKKILEIFTILEEQYSPVKSALNFSNPFELLIATILSAQCTDERVNKITADLFKKYKTPGDFIALPDEHLEKEIFSAGFYRQKAKSIKNCCRTLIDEYNSDVPKDFEALSRLHGVGRKTASVVAGNAFGIPAVAVDTHVIRLSNLLGFVNTKDPVKIEEKIKELLPENKWVASSHLLASHGRKVCIARRPKCGECLINRYCPSNNIED
jgi:endonuclease III